jgi:hypothetical protein
MNNKPSLDEIAAMFKGKGGNEESESILNDSNMDKKDGIVSVWSNKADAAKIIERCKGGIKNYELCGGGIKLDIDRKLFRGLWCAFRSGK